jgi:hypothetical protein
LTLAGPLCGRRGAVSLSSRLKSGGRRPRAQARSGVRRPSLVAEPGSNGVGRMRLAIPSFSAPPRSAGGRLPVGRDAGRVRRPDETARKPSPLLTAAAGGDNIQGMDEQVALAHHEAAHAVLHFIAGRRLDRIVLKRLPARFGGRVSIVPGRAPDAADYGAALAAGPLAHAKCLTGDMFAVDMFSDFDRRAIARAAEPGDPAEFLAASTRRAAAALENPVVWAAVEALARELAACWPGPDEIGEGVMDGETAMAIIMGAGAWPGMAGFGAALRWRAPEAEGS